jgi:hypothetical protein
MTTQDTVARKSLDNQEFFRLRQATEKIGNALGKRLAGHLETLSPLFVPRKLLGTFIKSAIVEDVPRSDKAFADLQERYAAVSEKPFALPKKLQPPLPSLTGQLDAALYQYPLALEGGGEGKPISVTSPVRWVLSFRSECPLVRLKAMLAGTETRNADDMRLALLAHLAFVVYLKHFPALVSLFEDLRYRVEVRELEDLGGLPVAMVTAPVETFLPPDEFILQITQLAGISAFQEIISNEAIDNIPDPLKAALRALLG